MGSGDVRERLAGMGVGTWRQASDSPSDWTEAAIIPLASSGGALTTTGGGWEGMAGVWRTGVGGERDMF